MKRLVAKAIVAAFLIAGAGPAPAQDAGLGGSFITPYPENDVYRVQVVGDWLADGLLGGLIEAFSSNPLGAQLVRDRYKMSGIMRRGSDREIADLAEHVSKSNSHIAIVMLGTQDRYSLDNRDLADGAEHWRASYGARVDKLMKALKKDGRAVYWVGMPVMRSWKDNKRAQIMNDVARERAYLNGVRYIDAYANSLDEGGGYSDYGPDITGNQRKLRYRDGVHFTQAGYRKLAYYVERELKRDIAQARQERSIPLAGAPAEQAKVNPDRVRQKAEAARAKDKKMKSPLGKAIAAPASRAVSDQKAEVGKVDVKVVGDNGAERLVSVEIVRPAIPASVVALMTRRSSADRAAQMGDILVDQIPGGLTVMSSIVPPRGGVGRRNLSPTQTPYFRVFERGERLVPKPGRADDFSWPRKQAAAVDTGSTTPSMPPIPVPAP